MNISETLEMKRATGIVLRTMCDDFEVTLTNLKV
jgi:hypothetical protein